MRIRHASPADLDAIVALEEACFPPEEAADRESFQGRLATYPELFWLLEDTDNGNALVSLINGFATDLPDLTDDMYGDASTHDPNGVWQMIFGVDTSPRYQHQGYASALMRRVIADTRTAGRRGLVLTCKDRLVGFYARFGFEDEGISESTHGGVVWHQMRLAF